MEATDKNKFFMTLLNAVTVIHTLHLQASSLNNHEVLDIYNDISNQVDAIVENDMAESDNKLSILDIRNSDIVQILASDPKGFLINLREYINQNVKVLLGGNSRVGVIAPYDSLVNTINSAIMKLTLDEGMVQTFFEFKKTHIVDQSISRN